MVREHGLHFCNGNYREERRPLEIRFVSSLTTEDEDRIAPALLTAISTLLDQFPIAYTVRIETVGSKVYQQHSLPEVPPNSSGITDGHGGDTLMTGFARIAESVSRAVRGRGMDTAQPAVQASPERLSDSDRPTR
jgi:hypothetical protein